MRYMHASLQKLSTPKTRALFSLAFMMAALFAMSSITFGQSPKVKPRAVHLKFVSEGTSRPEDVYFNAQAREVSAPYSLAANEMSATSIGSVLSLLFDSARVNLQTDSDPMVATWVGTVTVPTHMAAKPKPKSYLQHIRGSVTKNADARVTIFLDLGGKSFVAEFPYGMKHNGNILRRFVSMIKPGSSGRYTTSMVIIAERRNPTSALLVDIDGLDVDAR